MAGTNAAFNSTTFRQAIRSAMTMGLPGATQDRATFRWSVVDTYNVHDNAGRPYSWTSTPTTVVAHPDVQVPCAVQFSARPAGSNRTEMGEFDSSRVILTILDEDYALIQGANQVLLGGNTYDMQFVAPPMGLFDVTVYQVFLQARDEA